MRLEQSELAKADLIQLVQTSTESFGIERTLAYLDQIEHSYRQIKAFPESGRAEPALQVGIRSLPSGSHRIYYRIEDDVIVIRRILHKSRDAKMWLG